MSNQQTIRKIYEIKGNLKVCNICKIDLFEEYFNHIIVPWKHKPDPKVEYEFQYQLESTGKCERGCPRDAYCTIYHEESKYAQ